MALIKCPECGKDGVSDAAKVCPYCGYNIKKYIKIKTKDEQKKQKELKKELVKEKETQKKQKKNSKKYIVLICITLIICFGTAVYKPIVNYVNFHDAQEAMKSEEYDKAIEILSDINTEQSQNSINECLYFKATKMYEDGLYDDAIEIFKQLDSYQDSATMILECQYQKANRYKAEKDYETAADIYFSIEDFKDSKNQGIECVYHIAEAYYEDEEYYEAIMFLKENNNLLKDYKEAQDLSALICSQKDWFLDKAEQEYKNGNFEMATKCFEYGGESSNISGKTNYENCKFMLSIQGEYFSPTGKGTASVDKFIFCEDGVNYTIEPFDRPYKNGLHLVEKAGMLNGNKDDCIISSSRGYILHINENTWKDWETQEKIEADKKELERKKQQKEKTDKKKDPKIGMTASEIKASSWGEPKKINKTTYEWGTTEQWCYSGYRYIYFENGIVTAISE